MRFWFGPRRSGACRTADERLSQLWIRASRRARQDTWPSAPVSLLAIQQLTDRLGDDRAAMIVQMPFAQKVRRLALAGRT